MENLIALLGAVLALMGSPGPVTLASAAAGAAFGHRAALGFVVAATSGTWLVILLVALGVAGLIASAPGAKPAIGAVAGGYILYLAWRIATAPPLRGASERRPARPVEGFVLGITNPKAYAAMAALFSGFPLTGADPVTENGLKALLLGVCALGLNLVWMSLGFRLARLMQGPRSGRALNIAFAALLVASVGVMVLP